MSKCRRDKIIPHGLSVYVEPWIGNQDEAFLGTWHSIWPHVISRNNVHPILLPPLLIGLAKIQWSYCSSIYRCKLQAEPLLSQLWCQELSACLSSSYCLLSYLKNLFWVQVIGCFYRCLKSNMMLLIKNCCLL